LRCPGTSSSSKRRPRSSRLDGCSTKEHQRPRNGRERAVVSRNESEPLRIVERDESELWSDEHARRSTTVDSNRSCEDERHARAGDIHSNQPREKENTRAPAETPFKLIVRRQITTRTRRICPTPSQRFADWRNGRSCLDEIIDKRSKTAILQATAIAITITNRRITKHKSPLRQLSK
jgi:hypothetical protein